MNELMQQVAQQWAAQSPWEVVAVILAVAYVWLAARQSIWCWPAALVSTGIYSVLFWEYSLPFQMLLNVYYLLMAIYGWWHWQQGTTQRDLAVCRKSVQFHLFALVFLAVISFVLGWGATDILSSKYVYVDAAVTVFSLFTTYLVTQKVLENWLYWIVINAVAAWLYWQSSLFLSAILFASYIGFSLYGFLSWRGPSDKAVATS